MLFYSPLDNGRNGMYSKRKVALIVFFTFLATTVLCTASYTLVPAVGSALGDVRSVLTGSSNRELSSKMSEINGYIDNYYINKYDKSAMADTAAAGYVSALGDPYSEYIDAEGYKEMLEDLTGDYTGIGVEIYLGSDGLMTVLSAFDDGPASKAGIKPGDKIVAVGDLKITAENYNDAVDKMRGKSDKDTGEITVTIRRDGKDFQVKLKRAKVENQTVKTKMLDDNIGYVRISQFDQSTGEEFKRLTNLLLSDGAKSLIIDLRNNPGGVLDGVISVADTILGKCNIMTVKDKSGSETVYKSDKEELKMPICVLINGASASASEVLAGALRDNKKATLIGEKSYGKGVVQTVYNLSDGSALKITTAKYYTPSGECIDKKGIKPDIEVKMNADKPFASMDLSEDIQLQKAIEKLK